MINRSRVERPLLSIWYSHRRPPFGLQLLAHLFSGVSALRRTAYARGWLRSRRLEMPVVVIGNITVGGSGKTPLTIWLAKALREQGWRVGLVTPGYGGSSKQWPRDVTETSAAAEVGDEAVLLAGETGCPVVAGPDRGAAAARLAGQVDIILSDDGLQHYALARDFEIAVIDGERGFGNGWLLPAGPLREPVARIDAVDAIVVKGEASALPMPGAVRMVLGLRDALAHADGERRPLAAFRAAPVHAIAGIGNPEQFFAALRREGLEIIPHPFSDHAALSPENLDFGDELPVFMTEKDAVKLPAAVADRLWMIPAEAELPESEASGLIARIAGLIRVS